LQFHLRKRYKHFKRYREITNVLAKHGFGYLLNQLGLAEFINFPRNKYPDRRESPVASKARHLRLVLEELGPTFIKLGQLLSTRSDLLSADYVAELSKLQDEVPAFSFDKVKERVQMELGAKLEDIFLSFDREPLAAASIGQVHKATLENGEKVVVKVQRPGISAVTGVDIEILYDLAGLVDRHTPWGQHYSLVEVVEEFDRILREELDFTVEGKNIEIFRRNFAGDPNIRVPSVNWEYTTAKILTMEYIEGVKLTRPERLDEQNLNRKTVARRLADALLRQIFVHGFFHADPHPGNLAVLPGEKIVFMDFGIVGRLDDETRNKIANLVLGLIQRSTPAVVRAINSLGVVPGNVDFSALRRDIDRLREKYYEIPLTEISISESLGDIMQLTFNYNIRVPTEFTLLVKALITIEGITVKLDPRLSIMEILEPLGKKLLAQRFSPRSMRKMIMEYLTEYHSVFTRLPRHLNHVLELISSGELKFKTENPGQHVIIKHLYKICNRLAMSIVTAGLVISAALLAGKSITFWGIPVEQIALAGAALTVLSLTFSILRGGKL